MTEPTQTIETIAAQQAADDQLFNNMMSKLSYNTLESIPQLWHQVELWDGLIATTQVYGFISQSAVEDLLEKLESIGGYSDIISCFIRDDESTEMKLVTSDTTRDELLNMLRVLKFQLCSEKLDL